MVVLLLYRILVYLREGRKKVNKFIDEIENMNLFYMFFVFS